jgi:hypothetical protein
MIDSTQTLQAIAVGGGYSQSAVASATYNINLTTPEYTVSASPSTLTIVAGQSGTTTITVAPENGFSSQVNFACSGLPAGASCTFSPTSLSPNGQPVTTTLTIATTAATAFLRMPVDRSPRPIYAILFPGLAVICSFAAGRRKAGRSRSFMWLTLLSLALVLSSCSNGNPGTGGGAGTPPGTDALSVMASTGSSGINNSVTLTVKITQ